MRPAGSSQTNSVPHNVFSNGNFTNHVIKTQDIFCIKKRLNFLARVCGGLLDNSYLVIFR